MKPLYFQLTIQTVKNFEVKISQSKIKTTL